MSTTRVERDVAADPTGAALLLTSTDALGWWPGLRVGDRRGGAVTATLASRRTLEQVRIEALPPRRTPTSFVASFTVHGGSYGRTEGALTLTRSPRGTRAALSLDGPRDDLEGAARRFLGNLARAAEARAAS